ncbi:hypothetical protein TRFO_36368 [Tritrichomonas foetus]|uniref:Uncharacterized protein n=1 Tax=Tritrichomonas foetus TaxID=1144522 RepID=A0A1J4JE08_9EUKA|nr:hypothetical protein TRFO_36368 [Tritrichomonas foetus]|eukprot:OHS97394.1 hypothetical protein TRFO_36368 [Tritrichomonas foetus]
MIKSAASRALSELFGRFFDSIDSKNVSFSLLGGNCHVTNMVFKQNIFLDSNIPFLIESSNIESIDVDLSSKISFNSVKLVAKYCDINEFNPYVISPPTLSISEIISEKLVKKSIFSYLLNDQKIKILLHNFHICFEIPLKSNNEISVFGVIFEDIEIDNSKKECNINKFSIYISDKKEKVALEDLKNDFVSKDDFILNDFCFHGNLNNLQIEELALEFSFAQFQTFQMITRKFNYMKCGCPINFAKEQCYNWWKFGFRCFLADKNIFDINSTLEFLKNRKQTLNNTLIERNQLMMNNEYQRGSSNAKIDNIIDMVGFTKEEKSSISDYVKDHQNNSLFEFCISINKFIFCVRNSNGFFIISNAKLDKTQDNISFEVEQISISSDFTQYFFVFLNKLKLFQINHFKIPKITINDIENHLQTDIIEFVSFESKFSIKSIRSNQNGKKINETEYLLDNISCVLDPTNKFYQIKAEKAKLSIYTLFDIINSINQNNDRNGILSKILKKQKFSFSTEVSITDIFDLTFSLKVDNNIQAIAIDFVNIRLGQIFQNRGFGLSYNIAYTYQGRTTGINIDEIEISVFSSELELIYALLNKIMPFIVSNFMKIQFESFMFYCRGLKLYLETPENPLAAFSLLDITLKSNNGFSQFIIENNNGQFFDSVLKKWCILIQPFAINGTIQGRNISFSLPLQINLTNNFLNDMIEFLYLDQQRIELPRKYKIENFSSHQLKINDIILEKLSVIACESKKLKIESPGSGTFQIDIDSLSQFPSVISRTIIVSKRDMNITLSSPFIFENKSSNELFIWEQNNNKTIFSGKISNKEKLGVSSPEVIITGDNDMVISQKSFIMTKDFLDNPQLLNVAINKTIIQILLTATFDYELGVMKVHLLDPIIFHNLLPYDVSLFLKMQLIDDIHSGQKISLPSSILLDKKMDCIVQIKQLEMNSELAPVPLNDDTTSKIIFKSQATNQTILNLAMKIQYNPTFHNWKVLLFAPALFENKTNINLTINDVNQQISSKLDGILSNCQNIEMFGSDSYFSNTPTMDVFIGYNREYQFSEKPIEICFKEYSAPLLLKFLLNQNCYLPLWYSNDFTNTKYTNKNGKSKTNYFSRFITIEFYKRIENKTKYNISLTPIKEICDEITSDLIVGPKQLFEKGDNKPLMLTSQSFCFLFEIEEAQIPINLSENSFRTFLRVEKNIIISLFIDNNKVEFEEIDFSSQFNITITNLLENETVFISYSPGYKPIYIEPKSTTLFGYDSPFNSTEINVFAFDDQLTIRTDRIFEPISASKFVVEVISNNNGSFSILISDKPILHPIKNEFSFSLNIPVLEISLIDNRLTELSLICFYDIKVEVNSHLLTLLIKSIQICDMNLKTLFPTIISSNPENSQFLSLEVSYFDKFAFDRLVVSVSPILISPDYNFFNELIYFFRKIPQIFTKSETKPENILTRIKFSNLKGLIRFNLVEIKPIILILSFKNSTLRNLNTYKYLSFTKSVTDTIAIDGFQIMNSAITFKFLYDLFKNNLDASIYKKFFNSKENQPVYDNFILCPYLSFTPLKEDTSRLNEKPAAVIDALSQTEGFFKLASDKMRQVSDDKFIKSSNSSSKPRNAIQTVGDGFQTAAKSIGSGITGLFRKPIEGGQRDGAKGAFKGIGQGILGVVTCTVSSVIELGGGVAGGIRKAISKDNSSGNQCRPASTYLLRSISETNNNIIAETAQQEIAQMPPKEIEENLIFFSEVAKNKRKIRYFGVTENYFYLFNGAPAVVERISLKSIHKFTCENGKLVFSVLQKRNGPKEKDKEKLYDMPFHYKVNTELAIQFLAPKLNILAILQ